MIVHAGCVLVRLHGLSRAYLLYQYGRVGSRNAYMPCACLQRSCCCYVQLLFAGCCHSIYTTLADVLCTLGSCCCCVQAFKVAVLRMRRSLVCLQQAHQCMCCMSYDTCTIACIILQYRVVAVLSSSSVLCCTWLLKRRSDSAAFGAAFGGCLWLHGWIHPTA